MLRLVGFEVWRSVRLRHEGQLPLLLLRALGPRAALPVPPGGRRVSGRAGAPAAEAEEQGSTSGHPVTSFLQQQVRAGALQSDASQQEASRLLDGIFGIFVQHARQLARAASVGPQPAAAAAGGGHAQAQGASEAELQMAQQSEAATQQPIEAPAQQLPYQGAYLWGEVGSGKTLLMDTLYRAAAALPSIMPPGQEQRQQEQQQQRRRRQQQERQEQQAGGGILSARGEPQQHQAQQALGWRPREALGAAACDSGRPAAVRHKRMHFHAFMMEVHRRLHEVHQRVPRVAGKSRQGLPVYRYAPVLDDPVRLVGHQLAQEAQLLCLDELHVADVADALLLSKLFGSILERGTWVVFTSNRPPQDLYKGGLSRKYFEPFIHLVTRRLQVMRVGSGIDYRQQAQQAQHAKQLGDKGAAAGAPSRGGGLQVVGPAAEARQQLREAWVHWQQKHRAKALPGHKLAVGFGRELVLPEVAWRPEGLAAYLTFDQLCGRHGIQGHERQHGAALGPADFVALASQVGLVFLEGVPVLSPARRDEARRFVTLVDALYDYGAQLRCSLEAPPASLFLPLLAAAKAQGVDPNLGVAQGTSLAVPDVKGPEPGDRDPEDRTTRATLEEEVLMYQRAISRLQHMAAERG